MALIMHLNFDAVALPFSGALQNAVSLFDGACEII